MRLIHFIRRPGITAFLLAVFTLLLLISTGPKIGLTWDEPAYMAAAQSYTDWFSELFTAPSEAFKSTTINKYWHVNHEHPPMDKLWTGLVWRGARYVFDDLVAHRLGNMIVVSVMVAVLYIWVEKFYGWVAGLTAATVLLAMPRFFFHAHLAALDVPATFMVFLMAFLFTQWADKRSWKWTLSLGLVFSVAFATKVNTFFVPPTLFLWVLIFRRRWYLVLRLGTASLIGIGGAILLWPWLYPDIRTRLTEYINFVTVDHWKIGQWYLGRFYLPPPWHFSFVILWAVVPLTITCLYLLGAIKVVRDHKQDGGIGFLLLFSAFVPLLVLSFGQSMVYDNDRLFMPTFPFLAALAGIGYAWLVTAIREFGKQNNKLWLIPILSTSLVLIIFLPPVYRTISLYPHLLSYYAQSVGGLSGATKLGLETTYWCETYADALPYINDHAEPGDVIWVEPWSHDVLVYYQLEGMLRNDLIIAADQYASSNFGPIDTLGLGISRRFADYIIFQYRQTYYGGLTEKNTISSEWLELHTPVYQLNYQGIPLMSIFKQN